MCQELFRSWGNKENETSTLYCSWMRLTKLFFTFKKKIDLALCGRAKCHGENKAGLEREREWGEMVQDGVLFHTVKEKSIREADFEKNKY